jgi:hypothetical protein
MPRYIAARCCSSVGLRFVIGVPAAVEMRILDAGQLL